MQRPGPTADTSTQRDRSPDRRSQKTSVPSFDTDTSSSVAGQNTTSLITWTDRTRLSFPHPPHPKPRSSVSEMDMGWVGLDPVLSVADYCIVGIPHNTAIYLLWMHVCFCYSARSYRHQSNIVFTSGENRLFTMIRIFAPKLPID